MLTKLVDERRDLAVRMAELDRLIAIELAARPQDVQQDQTLLTAKTVARRLGISRVFLYELARLKKIRSTRIGRAVRFQLEDVTAYINRKVKS